MIERELVPQQGLPPQLQSLVERELRGDERVSWSDQPLPARMAMKALPLVLFGIPWTLFAMFWVAMALRGSWGNVESGNWLALGFPLFGVPFILVGFGMLSSPYFAHRAAKNSVYVLTNQRALTLLGGFRGNVTVRSFDRAQLGSLRRTERSDGTGDLVFSTDVRIDRDGDRRSTEVGFFGIREVKNVETMVRALASDRPRTA